jgi:Bacterial Ig-like domain
MSIHRRAIEYPRFMRSRSAMHASAWRAPTLGALLLALGCGAPAADIEGLGQSQAPLTANVAALLDFNSPDTAPFPSDLNTRDELRNLTGRRVHLPKPNCSQRPTDCQDIDVLNTLDGFSLQPRLRIAFTGAIDLSSVNSSTVFLVSRGDTTGGTPQNTVIGINQVVWDPSSNTLFAQPDKLLAQHTRYLLIITTGIRDTQGGAIGAGNFTPFPADPICTIGSFPVGQTDPCTHRARVLSEINAAGFNPSQIAAANTFTTQSVTAVLEKIRQ